MIMPSDNVNVFEAASAGNVAYLAEHKSHLADKTDLDWTALHYAALHNQVEAARFIADQDNCDLSAVNAEGMTAYDVAEFWGFDQVANLLRSKASATVVASDQHDKPKESPFPENIVNYFAGSPLNRCGWFRKDNEMLKKLASSPRSRYIVFSDLAPLYHGDELYFAHYDQLSAIVDRSIAFGTRQNEATTLVFLGIDERENKGDRGIAYWAIDITPQGVNAAEFKALAEDFKSRQLTFVRVSARRLAHKEAGLLDMENAAILGQARAMVDWHARCRFCSACGQETVSAEGGHKRKCLPFTDASGEQKSCIGGRGVQNITYPRTDPVIIVCIIHPSEDKILLGRKANWPDRMHSCIAGFVEAGESIEEAVRREAYEEAGIVVDRVVYHSSQPWPFPNSLMFGFIAEATSTEVKFEDKELESAVWFTRAEILSAMNGDPEAPLSLPIENAIAYRLIQTWATDKKWTAN